MDIFLRLGWFFKRHWLRYVASIGLLVLVSLADLFPPWLIGQLVDDIQAGTFTSEDIIRSVVLIVLTGLVIYLLRNGWRILLFGSAIELGRVLRTRLFHHFTRMSPEFYQRYKTGDLMAHATNDVRAVESTAAEGVLTLVDSVIAGSAVIIAMVWVCGWELTMVALLPFPAMAWLIYRYASLLRTRFGQAQAAFSDLNNRVQETVSGIRAVRAHALGSGQRQHFGEQSGRNVSTNMQVARVDALFDPTISICVGLSMLSSLGFGAWQIQNGSMTVGELTTFTIYLGLLVWPMFAFGWLFNIVERGSASMKRLESLLGEMPDVTDTAADIHDQLQGDIDIRCQGFTYPGAERQSLQPLEISISQGSFVGLCGKTGSGKTSLFRLLLRQYDSDSVNIDIGQQAHDSVSLDALRSRFALVSQEPFLFSASIADNIAFGRPEATREEIEQVASLACIHEDILGFSEGYETLLGEKGVNLSGGQKQRLTIARALLLRADILLLDDAFCSLDMKTEARILDNLMQSERRPTIVLITQRLTNLHKADQVIVMEEGQVAESGNHSKLMAGQSWYARIFRRQSMEISAAQVRAGQSNEIQPSAVKKTVVTAS